MRNSSKISLSQLFKLLLLAIAAFGGSPIWAGDISTTLFYTQYAFQGNGPAVGAVHLQYTAATNSLTFSGNSILISGATNSNFGGADGILTNSNNGNLLIAGGGSASFPGIVYQITQAGAPGSPFSVTMSPATTAYTLTIVPSNGSNSGFPSGTLIATEKDFGYGHISIYPLSPSLANGVAYPVTGDDQYVTGVAFGSNGVAYYGSGTESSNAGNFGTITFDGVEFVTHRLFGQPVGFDPRGGVIYTGTHRLSFDPYTGDIFTAGGNTVGQYDPGTNTFHILSIYGPANNFELATPVNDGNGHVLVTACCGLAGDSENGEGDLLVVDYSSAPNHVIDASSGVHYNYAFLATNLGAVVIGGSGGGISPTPPVITQQPQNASAIVNETATFSVAATGTAPLNYQWSSNTGSGFGPIPGATSSTYTTRPAIASDNGTQFLCTVTNSQGSVSSTIATLTVLTNSANFITSASLGTLRNNYTGWVGMSISVGASPLTVTSLGRMFAVGNNGTHLVKIVNAASGSDVPGGSVSISMSGGAPSTFVFANLSSSVTLNANTSYYIVTQETAGGDEWYDWNTTAQTSSVASLSAAAYGGPPYIAVGGSNGHLYGPVDFRYAVSVLVTVAPASVMLSNSGTQQFSATVTGTSNNSVTWSINPAAGNIDTNSGFYTAPTGISSSQSITVTATSTANPASFGTATVNLVPPSLPVITQQPQSTTVTPGSSATFSVGASGASSYQWQSKTPGASVFSSIPGATSGSYTTPATALTDSGTQFLCIVSNSQGPVSSNSAVLTVASGSGFVSSFVLGTARNNYTGWVGMAIAVGNAQITVTSLGRMVAPGNSGTHSLKIVNAASGSDVSGSLTSVNTAGAPSGSFLYATLSSSVVLQANTSYYIMTQESFGGDQWYDLNTSLQNASVASITAPVYSSGSSYITIGGMAAHSYGPVDFRYTAGSTGSSTFVSSVTPGTVRNDFSGWVGVSVTIGANAVKVTQLGRFVLSGNTGAHTVKIVSSSGANLPGGSVSVNVSGGQPGAFVYAALANPITLSANTNYYIVSQEVQGGDAWYDWNTFVTTAAGASDSASVWSPDGVSYDIIPGSSNHMYVPVDFVYTF